MAGPLLFLLQGIPRLLTPLVMLLAGLPLGWLILRVLGAERPGTRRHPDLLDGVAAGLGTLSTGILLLGAAGGVRKWLLATVLLVCLGGGARAVARRLATSADSHRGTLRKATLAGWCGVGFLVLLFLADLARALVPPTFYDPLVQSLAFPAQYRVLGKVVFFSWNFQAGFPQGSEMLALVPLTFQGPASAALVELLFGWLCVAAIFRLGAEAVGERTGLLAALIFASIPGIGFSMGAAKSDLALVFYEVLAARALLEWHRWGRREDLRRAGLLFGFALGTKYLALFFIAAAALVILGSRRAGGGTTGRLKAVLRMAAAAFLIAAPWFARNLIHTGNPLFPLLPSVLDGPGWSPEQAALMARDTRHPSLVPWREILNLPWRMSTDGRRLGAGGVLGPLYLALVPLFVFIRREPGSRGAAWIGVLGLASLLLGYTQTILTRYHWAGFALLAIPAAVSASRLITGKLRAVGICLLGLGLASNLVYRLAIQELAFGGWDLMTGRISREDFVASRDPSYRAERWANAHLPGSARLLLIGETRWLYLERPAVAPAAYDRPLFERLVREAPDPAALRARLTASGFTHLLLNLSEVQRLSADYGAYAFTEPERRRVEAFFRALPPVYRDDAVQIFALR